MTKCAARTASRVNHLQFQTSIGTIAVTWSSRGLLTRIDWFDTGPGQGRSALSRTEVPGVLGDLVDRLGRYFESGEPIRAVPWEVLDLEACSPFQRDVFRAISEIPHGETRTYAWVSRRVGRIAATRAVGQALRRNPLPILIPCHRVVSTNTLGGFMGITDPDQPEIRLKRGLIELENGYLNPVFAFLARVPRAERQVESPGAIV